MMGLQCGLEPLLNPTDVDPHSGVFSRQIDFSDLPELVLDVEDDHLATVPRHEPGRSSTGQSTFSVSTTKTLPVFNRVHETLGGCIVDVVDDLS